MSNVLAGWLLILSFSVMMGLFWRIRGGWLGLPSSTLGRLVPATFFGSVLHQVGVAPWHALIAGLALWLGTIFPWAQWMDMGRVEENDDEVGMTGRGMVLFLPFVLVLTLFDYLAPGSEVWFLALGGMMGPIYWLSWKLCPTNINLFWGAIDGPTSIGELVTGFWVMFTTLFFLLAATKSSPW